MPAEKEPTKKGLSVEVKAPGLYDAESKYTIFLAGAIDQGKAVDWQKEVATALSEFDVLVLNPRRDDWDSSWEQSKDNPELVKQINWELDAQEAADMVLFVFTKDSKAPITFLEMGLFAKDKDALVCAETGFYRMVNLEVVCERYSIPIYHNLESMLEDLKNVLSKHFGGPAGPYISPDAKEI
jgi:nucleoside 2-deoxyribosyltransferase-like protein